jgi:enamine deaminase RidA (YjgF/YER057c/UK114 family)
MTIYLNPFPADADRHEIWDMLVRRDIEAFVAGDWALTAPDFDEAAFFAVDARASANPDTWLLSHASLDAYRDDWLAQSHTMRTECVDLEASLYQATTLRDIDISLDRAVAHKKFDGIARRHDGSDQALTWQTLYHCRRVEGRWRIVGFTGYLPHPNTTASLSSPPAGKRRPEHSSQHVTAGPYSPSMIVQPGRLVVISGQAALNDDGIVIGDDIADQARFTLDNCRRQLHQAGAGLQDVFKVNVYLNDLADWPQFNDVYRGTMLDPLPVRTTVGTHLLSTLLVEVEMWAVIP